MDVSATIVRQPFHHKVDKKIVIGLGSGRCGTHSLKDLLNEVPDIYATHELRGLPWLLDTWDAFGNLVELDSYADTINKTIISDVGFYWINYIYFLREWFPGAKFICLKRAREKVVYSFYTKKPTPNWWTHPASKYWDGGHRNMALYDICFPRYDLPKEKAIGAYWDIYYGASFTYKHLFPETFMEIDMDEALNTDKGKRRIFDFISNGQKSRK